MNGEYLKPTMAMIAGLWPSPPVSYEEALAWSAELTGRLRITSEEANTVLAQFAESGLDDAKYRPRPGQIVAMVQHLRRRRALDRPQVGALMPAPRAENHDSIAAENLAVSRRACESARPAMHDRRQRVREMAK